LTVRFNWIGIGKECPVTNVVDPLILDLLEWISPRPRPYSEVIEVWRTSCPRLPVWEEANERGFIDHAHETGREAHVSLSARGREFLKAQRGTSVASTR
jgi:hypothetical protein